MRPHAAGGRGLTWSRPVAAASLLLAAATLGCSAATEHDDPGAPVSDVTPAASASSRRAEARADALVLRPPEARVTPSAPQDGDGLTRGRHTLAYQFNAPIYRQPDARRIRGFARRGARLPVARWLPGTGCERGWLELSTGGYVCNALGFDTTRTPTPLPETLRTPPAADRPLPFDYARVRHASTPVWNGLPGDDEAPAALTEGVVFVAIDRALEQRDGVAFVRDVRGRVLREADLVPAPTPTLRGEALGEGAARLPLAFVHEPQSPILDRAGAHVRGVALRFSRFAVEGETTIAGHAFVTTPHGAIARAAVRVARRIERPEGVGEREQWIHVDLAEQTLVAYEGDRPVRATLVSSGKPGYEPPLGLFRVHKKYATKRMQGDDPIDGSYDIDQVPWTMYYWGSFALHGAYWHDGFGHVRSHGCTNIPPVDARWLFHWAEPALRPGWHAEVGLKGPWVYTTDGTTPDQ